MHHKLKITHTHHTQGLTQHGKAFWCVVQDWRARFRVENLHRSFVFLLCPLQAVVTVKVTSWFWMAAGTVSYFVCGSHSKKGQGVCSSSLPHLAHISLVRMLALWHGSVRRQSWSLTSDWGSLWQEMGALGMRHRLLLRGVLEQPKLPEISLVFKKPVCLLVCLLGGGN